MRQRTYHAILQRAKLKSAIEECPELQERSALWLLLNLAKAPLKVHACIRHNAVGHVNHSLFWRAMSHGGQGSPAPVGALAEALDRDFGRLEQFKQIFTARASSCSDPGRFGWRGRGRMAAN